MTFRRHCAPRFIDRRGGAPGLAARPSGGCRALTYNPGVPESSSFVSRPAADRCPGALRLIEAADGFLARVRLPGGLVSAGQLRALARLADQLGDGRAELTSRGNVQLRGLAAATAGTLTSELASAGLLPSLSHDQVRNVIASPLAGLDRGPDLTGLVRALDTGLCARPRLAELPGRFLFAVDDGRGDVAGLGADVVATVRADATVANRALVNGAPVNAARVNGAVVNGLSVGCPSVHDADAAHGVPGALRDSIVAAMLACADAFLDLRAETGGTAWRVTDLADGAEQVRAAAGARLGLAAAGEQVGRGEAGRREAGPGEAGPGEAGRRAARPAGATRPVGLVSRKESGEGAELAATVRDDLGDSAVLLAPLGRLTAAQLSWIADRLAGADARVTPWRSIVLPRLPDAAAVLREAAGLGFGTDAGSPWLRVTACAGRPGCASALADVQADAAGFAARWPGRLVHVSGCARHCGRPAATEIDVTAASEGYQVAGV
jgi:precorrin-3B synthase